ncbi:hypothetical protein GCM10009623_21550 [Nocardioides aestuarii]|uniref:Uncharacterized protein n=1 Tax=Nocardioides aestuarii TaxID=252231 RepID=A0ABW4TNF8_9ACTN
MTTSTRTAITTVVRRSVAAFAVAAAAVGAVHAVPADAATTAGTTTIRPGQLDRGAGPAVPVTLGTVILDGDRSVEVDAHQIHLLGSSGDDYVVEVYDGEGARVERVTPDGARTPITQRIKGQLLLSQDGDRLYEAITRGRRDAVVRVRDAATGDLQHKMRFEAPVTVAGADGDTAIVATNRPNATYRWDLAEPRLLTMMAGKAAYDADVRADRYVVGKGRGENFCTQVRSISSPHTTTWRTCRHSVLEIQNDSRRMIAGSAYLDGPISSVTLRAPRGRELHGLRLAHRAIFGTLTWEDADHVLAEVYTNHKVSYVRCDAAGSCERASDVEDNPYGG